MKNTTKVNYISVKDFASRINLTSQAVYLRIRNDPDFKANFVRDINGQLMINAKALEEVYGIVDDPEEQTDNKPQDNDSQTIMIKVLQDTIELLRKELIAKNEQLERLQEALINQQKLSLLDKKADPVDTESTTADTSNTDDNVVSNHSGSVDNTINQPTKKDGFFSHFRFGRKR